MTHKACTPTPGRSASTRSALQLSLCLTLLLTASCSQIPTRSQLAQTPESSPEPAPAEPLPLQAQEPKPSIETLWEWSGEGRSVSHIWIDVNDQRARFYDGQEQIGWTFVASGLKSYPTPTGQFAIIEKTSKKRSNLYGKIYDANGRVVNSDAKRGRDRVPPGGRFVGAKMPYFMRLTYDGIGMHAGPIPVPGFPASHGCIRMPKDVAPLVFRHVARGTPVTITGDGPEYGDYSQGRSTSTASRSTAVALDEPLVASHP